MSMICMIWFGRIIGGLFEIGKMSGAADEGPGHIGRLQRVLQPAYRRETGTNILVLMKIHQLE
jgi:hypothetical protein